MAIVQRLVRKKLVEQGGREPTCFFVSSGNAPSQIGASMNMIGNDVSQYHLVYHIHKHGEHSIESINYFSFHSNATLKIISCKECIIKLDYEISDFTLAALSRTFQSYVVKTSGSPWRALLSSCILIKWRRDPHLKVHLGSDTDSRKEAGLCPRDKMGICDMCMLLIGHAAWQMHPYPSGLLHWYWVNRVANSYRRSPCNLWWPIDAIGRHGSGSTLA